jgi:gamma-glutamylcyclotransferase (GGCT)/AIG2-like uncharacterized protein YtfP
MKIFAYGALMSLQHMNHYALPFSSRIPAMAKGYRLVFEKKSLDHPLKGWANIRKSDSRDIVHGILYEISDVGVAMIDIREDYPHGYTREKVLVSLQNGETVEAVSYIAHPDMIQTGLFPTAEYVQLICESSDLLPEQYLQTIRLVKTLEEVTNVQKED